MLSISIQFQSLKEAWHSLTSFTAKYTTRRKETKRCKSKINNKMEEKKEYYIVSMAWL